MKKKLCYVLPKYSEADATHFSYIHEFLKAIAKEFNVYLLVERGSTPPKELGYKCVKVLWFQFFPLRVLETFFRFLSIRRKGYKNVYVHYSFLAAHIASSLKMRVWYWNCGEPWKYSRSSLRDKIEKRVYQKITFLVTGTKTLKAHYAKEYSISEEKIIVMPNWIALKNIENPSEEELNRLRRKLGIEIDQRVLLFVHRLSKRKGAHHLPDMLNGLRDENVVLLVVGDGPERKCLETEMKKRKLWTQVRFLEILPNYQLPSYYFLSDVFLMPSDEEGFPHVLLEAMATGTQFVAADVGGVKDIIPQTLREYLVPQGDVDQFVLRAKNILKESPREAEKIREALKLWVRRYDLPRVVRIFKEVISV